MVICCERLNLWRQFITLNRPIVIKSVCLCISFQKRLKSQAMSPPPLLQVRQGGGGVCGWRLAAWESGLLTGMTWPWPGDSWSWSFIDQATSKLFIIWLYKCVRPKCISVSPKLSAFACRRPYIVNEKNRTPVARAWHFIQVKHCTTPALQHIY